MKTNEKKLGFVTLGIACLLVMLNRVLISATVQPDYFLNPNRFYIYSFLKAISIVGGSLIPIFFGFHYRFLLRNNLRNKLARYYLLFILIGWFINIFFYLMRSDLVLRDYWIGFFPISQNYFVYATSFVLVILLFSLVYEKLKKTEDKAIRMIFLAITILFAPIVKLS